MGKPPAVCLSEGGGNVTCQDSNASGIKRALLLPNLVQVTARLIYVQWHKWQTRRILIDIHDRRGKLF